MANLLVLESHDKEESIRPESIDLIELGETSSGSTKKLFGKGNNVSQFALVSHDKEESSRRESVESLKLVEMLRRFVPLNGIFTMLVQLCRSPTVIERTPTMEIYTQQKLQRSTLKLLKMGEI
jgi:hypothetical protein